MYKYALHCQTAIVGTLGSIQREGPLKPVLTWSIEAGMAMYQMLHPEWNRPEYLN